MKVLITITAILLMILVVISALLFFNDRDEETELVDPPFELVVVDNVVERSVVEINTSPVNKKRIILKNGDEVLINDFSKMPEVTDVGLDMYHLQGLPGNTDAPVSLLFDANKNNFAISIDSLPIKENREVVSNILGEMLGLTESQMCELNTYVGVTYDVDPFYAGTNLGLSFCPNSVPLE